MNTAERKPNTSIVDPFEDNNDSYEKKLGRIVVGTTFGTRDQNCSYVCPEIIDYPARGECGGCAHYQRSFVRKV